MGKDFNRQPTNNESSISLKGTFIAVMLLGVFILISWFGIYALFISR
ncbi:cytochrome c oxidase subunit 2A [Sporosarcina sp. CAU 1771]